MHSSRREKFSTRARSRAVVLWRGEQIQNCVIGGEKWRADVFSWGVLTIILIPGRPKKTCQASL